ncbi:hypothetical protein NP233_g10356 [Leucocoprinus birnbaumii]|uniref:Uncharacterized protein n=1 Tax=Leucocoprinus birnbaumii TaxID=56174 RepID=A0AAD5VKI0_9AGAR|nr:hypothetical protein NP233_g10356 [Leucocoprinus birnbaumii]
MNSCCSKAAARLTQGTLGCRSNVYVCELNVSVYRDKASGVTLLTHFPETASSLIPALFPLEVLMAMPNIEEIKAFTRKRVIQAHKEDLLHVLTHKVLRREIEEHLNLDKGDLDAAEYRSLIKSTIESTLSELDIPKEEEDAGAEKSSKSKSPKRAQGKKRASDVGLDEVPKKKARVNSKEDQSQKQIKKQKSKATVDKEPLSPSKKLTTGPVDSPDEDGPSGTKLSPKRRRKALTRIDDSEDEDTMPEVKPEPQNCKVVNMDQVNNTIPDPEERSPLEPQDGMKAKRKMEYGSDSELSVLIDETPKRKRKSKAEKAVKGKAKKSESLSKDEETIKKLKGLVAACGIRKVWSKVFQGLDTPSQQIKKLKEILHELGMTGRMSMEKAKAIREKREFEQELRELFSLAKLKDYPANSFCSSLEDVQEFQKAVMKSGRKPDTRIKKNDKQDSDSEKNEEVCQLRYYICDPADFEHALFAHSQMTAAQRISAFLGDSSSDEA